MKDDEITLISLIGYNRLRKKKWGQIDDGTIIFEISVDHWCNKNYFVEYPWIFTLTRISTTHARCA
jgi:hypothetical protein